MVIATPARVKPRLRGVFHELGFYVALGLGSALVVTADAGRPRLAAAVFSSCVILCFGASALYHRPTWTPRVRAWLARLDHAGVYLLIAGSYTPFGLLVMSEGWAIPVLTIVWTGAFAAIMLKFLWVHSPKWLSAVLASGSDGWPWQRSRSSSGCHSPDCCSSSPAASIYTGGAIVYVRRQPDPMPSVLGYHELFHVATLVATGCMYAAIAFFVLPRG